MQHPFLLTIALATALFGSARPALAHAELVRATPQADSVVSASPTELRLVFSERVEPGFSRATIAGRDGKAVPAGRPQVRGAEMVIPIVKALPPGVYRVNWQALSVDSHKVQGSFGFEVRP